jgi:hypothetical protein
LVAVGPRNILMYYSSFDEARGRFVVGLAKSADGFKWVKNGVVFDPVVAAGSIDPQAHDIQGAASIQVVSG